MELKAYERFELAVDAVVDGDLVVLKAMLREYPELVRMRSSRVTEFDAKPHRSTLLHIVAGGAYGGGGPIGAGINRAAVDGCGGGRDANAGF